MDNYGTEARKLARKDSHETSKAAANSAAVLSGKMEKMVHLIITGHGETGCISDEVRDIAREEFNVHGYSSVTARYKALEEKGFIKFTGETRQGHSGKAQRVMVSTGLLPAEA